MLPNEKRDRQAMLREYILKLSESLLKSSEKDGSNEEDGSSEEDSEVVKTILKIGRVYGEGFRHSYSDFFPVILEIFEEGNLYSPDYLLENLQKIRDVLEASDVNGEKRYDKMYDPFVKLCEHLNLQISQLRYFTASEEKIIDASNRLKEAKDSILQSERLLLEANEKIKIATQKANSIQTELIAVLSIFASIVLTFAGGINILGNSITAISSKSANLYYVILVCLVCGIVFFNTVFLLMYLISKITERNIYARCESLNCTCGEGGKPKCKGLDRIRKRLPYVFYFNIVLLLLAAADFGVIVFQQRWLFNT